MSLNNRRKGHDLERQVARDLKELFPFVKTTRASSKLYDDCGIDLNFVPVLIQCKNGYIKNRPKYEVHKEEVIEKLNQNFPKDHPIHTLPYALIHKISKKNTQVTIDYDFFLFLMTHPKLQESNIIQ